jgi:general secretion pathway protein G
MERSTVTGNAQEAGGRRQGAGISISLPSAVRRLPPGFTLLELMIVISLIDQYAADKGKLPQSLDELVSSGYMREIPKDPITDQKDWAIATGDDPYSTEGGTGITDVHSGSGDVSSEGTPYSEW